MSKKQKLSTFESWRRSGKTALPIAAMSAIVAIGTVGVIPTASAQNGEHQTNTGSAVTATYEEGSDYPADGELKLQAEGRLGNSNSDNPLSGDWELGVGTNTQDSETASMAQYDWTTSAQTGKDFTVTYDGSGEATMSVEGGESTSFNVGELSEDDSLYLVGANKAGASESTQLTNLQLNGEELTAVDDQGNEIGNDIILGGTDSEDTTAPTQPTDNISSLNGNNGSATTENNGGDTTEEEAGEVGYMKIDGADLSQGFTASGTAYFTSPTASGSEQAFQLQVRSDSETDTEEDTTAPSVDITAPEDGATISGNTEVRASIDDENPKNYHLRVEDESGKKVLDEVYDQEEAINDEVIKEFDTTKVANGTYTVSLAAEDQAGNMDGSLEDGTDGESVDTHTVTVDNEDGTGGEGLTIDGEFSIDLKTGESTTLEPEVTGAADADLTYNWEVSDDKLVKGNTPMDQPTLEVGPAPAGDYTATLTVSDQDGNETEATYDISITEGNGGVSGGGEGNISNNPFTNFFVNVRGNVENLFVNVSNFFGFRS